VILQVLSLGFGIFISFVLSNTISIQLPSVMPSSFGSWKEFFILLPRALSDSKVNTPV